MQKLVLLILLNISLLICKEGFTEKVNVFFGSADDHGQLSPSASYPFSMISVGSQTSPYEHMGYDYYSDTITGFTHNRIEGVGCGGAGGNLLIKPLYKESLETNLIKKEETAFPGYYKVEFNNGIESEVSVFQNYAVHNHYFPSGNPAYLIDFSHSFDGFDDEEHQIVGNSIFGWIKSKTTCGIGSFKVFYFIEFEDKIFVNGISEHKIIVKVNNKSVIRKDDYPVKSDNNKSSIKIGFSSVNSDYAKDEIKPYSLSDTKSKTIEIWNKILSRIKVSGDEYEVNLFYTLLYRILQSPYLISEEDGTFRNIDGRTEKSDNDVYHGWAVWDNYRSQLPFLSLFYSDYYKNMVSSLAEIFQYGRHDWSEDNEPAQTVRTEHAVVVLLDAYRKGYNLDFNSILDSLKADEHKYNYDTPDKALESYYDIWALSEIMKISGDDKSYNYFRNKLDNYKDVWIKDFYDITAEDADSLKARELYQGTVWQYRWSVPFDINGLVNMIGSKEEFISQLDTYWETNMHNQGNQPSLHVPILYNAAGESWKSQQVIHDIIADTVKQIYGAHTMYDKPYIGRIYRNQPEGLMYEMDDDLGTMSAWYCFASMGLFPACVGHPVYYLNAPLFENIEIDFGDKTFEIAVEDYDKNHKYIEKVILNNKQIKRNYLYHDEIISGGKLIIYTSDKPNKELGSVNYYQTNIKR